MTADAGDGDDARNPNATTRPPSRAGRIRVVGLALVAAVVIAVLAVVLTSGGSSGGPVKAPTTRRQTESVGAQIDALLAGIPQSGTRLGNTRAPVTMTYFGDLECPYCAAFTVLGGFSQLVATNVRRGQVKVVYRSLCTATCNDSGTRLFVEQQVAAYAAGHQDRFWQYAELFYHEQGAEGSGYVTPSFLVGLAKQVTGLNLSQWQVYLRDPLLVGQLQADQKAAARIKATSTPTLIMTGPRGSAAVPTPSNGIPTYSLLEATIARVT